METQEKTITRKGKINAAIMKHRALWGYNRYEVLRGRWKGGMVPGLTFGNAVVCLKSGVRSGLDGDQRSVRGLALGAPGKSTNEAVQGMWVGQVLKRGKLRVKVIMKNGSGILKKVNGLVECSGICRGKPLSHSGGKELAGLQATMRLV